MFNKKRTLEILDKSSNGDRIGIYCDRFLSTLILLNLLAVSLESIDSLGLRFETQFLWFELFSVGIFGMEYLLRIWASSAREDSRFQSATGRRLGYIFSFTGIIDLVAILPSLLPLFLSHVDLRWLRVLRLFRLLKISHYSTALEDLVSAVREEANSFGATVYLFCVALFTSSALMYVVENRAQPEHFASIPETMWWALITLTTVGYGDVAPITGLGKIIGAFTALMGVCVVALLTGIVATAFANQIDRRKLILEAEIASSLEDGIITDKELMKIRQMQKQMHLTDEHIQAIIELMRNRELPRE